MKGCIDRGHDPENVRPGVASAPKAPHISTALVEPMWHDEEGGPPVHVTYFGTELDFMPTTWRGRDPISGIG